MIKEGWKKLSISFVGGNGFNKSINYAPSAPDAAKLRRLLKRYNSEVV
ncbi:hypothetical protein SAMN02745132_01554 [Enterovibrio nigricans DSM 22720]|uniref:Uncharacterized protein n=1 Tax=Enterovibrio nigricans DSM 22720 TaxID=1121868 RepID=A0A1T4UEX1_9GAMM|nr:hypothetical protein SAMN02745132_01554 [Enterovibrio nigricans DSM 22720]